MRTKTIFTTVLVLASIFLQSIPIFSQGISDPIDIPNDPDIDNARIFAAMAVQGPSADLTVFLERLFGKAATDAATSLGENSADLLLAVTDATDQRAGSMDTDTTVQLQLTGMLDRTVDATNAYIASITGRQQMVDFEYDRYKIDGLLRPERGAV